MGTRADFYIGRGPNAEWLGSIAMDGYPSGIPDTVLCAVSESLFRKLLGRFFADKHHHTPPEQGWPWPWNDSRTTNYAYAFDTGEVWASNFGCEWFRASEPEPEDESEEKTAVFPDMSARKNVAWYGPRSGQLVVTGDGRVVG